MNIVWNQKNAGFKYLAVNSKFKSKGIIYGVAQDITDHKKAEQALEKTKQKAEESEKRLKILINTVPDIICFKDGEGRWLIANDADLKLFQLEGVDYYGKKDSELAKGQMQLSWTVWFVRALISLPC